MKIIFFEGRITPLFLVFLLPLASCASFAPCDPTLATAAAGLQTPPNKCRVDGCTLSPDFDFAQCCNEHDIRYWAGGTACERKAADLKFQQCIRNANHPIAAKIYYYGVRLGGTPHLPTAWRWGFGWDFPNGYEADVNDENSQHCSLESSDK